MKNNSIINHTFIGLNDRPPFWYMRQAGRYLPEYMEIRNGCGGFMDLCFNPEKAAEVTLQPLRRFDMDAAIIFSDILVIPHALGQEVTFKKGEGPLLPPLQSLEELTSPTEAVLEKELAAVYEALRRVKAELSEDKTLIGFAGAPWTLACYMLEGRGKTGFTRAREVMYNGDILVKLTEILTEAIAKHLCLQVEAGAQMLQLFDSWSELVPPDQVEALVIEPARQIISFVKERHPSIPIIGFPRGLGSQLRNYATTTGIDGLSVDTVRSLSEVASIIPEDIVLQGNLDPLLLASSKQGTLQAATSILHSMRDRRFIFNLGHGIVPHTPPENVAALSELLRNGAPV